MSDMLRDDRVAKIARWRVQLYISSTETSSSLYCNGLPEFRALLFSRGGYMKGKFLGSLSVSGRIFLSIATWCGCKRIQQKSEVRGQRSEVSGLGKEWDC